MKKLLITAGLLMGGFALMSAKNKREPADPLLREKVRGIWNQRDILSDPAFADSQLNKMSAWEIEKLYHFFVTQNGIETGTPRLLVNEVRAIFEKFNIKMR